ncbi:MAG TPA: sulfotransferase [Steroidobacteraceae bacterium]|jgi:tetratricopeptide (TPR) repeat protein
MNSSPEPQIRQAQALQQAGRLTDAEQAYAQILARWPALPDCWYNLGVVQRLQGRAEEALASYREALNHGVSRPEEVHLNRAVILSDALQRVPEAESELQTALRLNPTYLPAMLNLANLHEDRGERNEARALYGKILTLDPLSFLAFARLANLMPRGSHDTQLIGRLRSALARAEASAGDRAHLGFALGRALDGTGDYAGAFAAWQAANRDSRASAADPVHYDRRAHEQIVDELIATALPPPVSADAQSRPRPVFILGMYRSGSTLTEQLLAGHPDVGAGGELSLLPRLISTELLPFPAALARAPAAQLARLAAGYRASIAALFPTAALVTDKRPDNFFCIGLIKTLFPDAQIVHTVRDPLDTCLSVFFLHLDHRLSYALDLADIGHFYRQYQRLMTHWKRLYGESIIDFDYDRFVTSPEPTGEALFAALGLKWDAGLLDFPRRPRSVRTASVWQVREPLYQHASGRARHYERELAPLRAELGLEPAAPPAGAR